MIRHTILFRVKTYTKPNEIEHALALFAELKSELPGIIEIISGECHFHDEKSSRFFSEGVSHGISIDFEDQTALDRFFKDAVTHPAKEAIINITEGGYDGLVGFNFVDSERF